VDPRFCLRGHFLPVRLMPSNRITLHGAPSDRADQHDFTGEDTSMKTFLHQFYRFFTPRNKQQDKMLRLYLAHLNGPPRIMPMLRRTW
jgi:hypothetical protein